MEVQEKLKPELEEALGIAWSCSERPPGKYIGSITKGSRTFYFYKNGLEYFYETDFDREMKQKEKERRWNRKRGVGKASY